MKRPQYIEPEKHYLISNHFVARHACFEKRYYCERFLLQFVRYISPMADLIAYHLDAEGYVFLIKTKKVDKFVNYHTKKQKYLGHEIVSTPLPRYIFSQAMANFQASMSIHLNRKEGRLGALFMGRYEKELLREGESLERIKERLDKGLRKKEQKRKWKRVSKNLREFVWFRNFKPLINRAKKTKKAYHLINALRGQLLKTKFYTSMTFFLPFLTPP